MITFDELENNSFGLAREKPKRVRKPLTKQQQKDRIRKRNSYASNVNTAIKLKGYGVPIHAIYPVLMDLHHLKRYTWGKNVIYAKESIELIKEDLLNKTLKL